MGCHFLLQGIFATQGSNSGLLHCRQILDRLEPPRGSLLRVVHVHKYLPRMPYPYIWNYAPNLFHIFRAVLFFFFLTVASECEATPRRTDGACNCQHYKSQRGLLEANSHALVVAQPVRGFLGTSYTGGGCDPDSSLLSRGGAGSNLRLPVAKRRSFHKPD